MPAAAAAAAVRGNSGLSASGRAGAVRGLWMQQQSLQLQRQQGCEQFSSTCWKLWGTACPSFGLVLAWYGSYCNFCTLFTGWFGPAIVH